MRSKRAVTIETRALTFQHATGRATQSIIKGGNGSTISLVLPAGDITTNPLPTGSSDNLEAPSLYEAFSRRLFTLMGADVSSLFTAPGNPDLDPQIRHSGHFCTSKSLRQRMGSNIGCHKSGCSNHQFTPNCGVETCGGPHSEICEDNDHQLALSLYHSKRMCYSSLKPLLELAYDSPPPVAT